MSSPNIGTVTKFLWLKSHSLLPLATSQESFTPARTRAHQSVQSKTQNHFVPARMTDSYAPNPDKLKARPWTNLKEILCCICTSFFFKPEHFVSFWCDFVLKTRARTDWRLEVHSAETRKGGLPDCVTELLLNPVWNSATVSLEEISRVCKWECVIYIRIRGLCV